MHACAKAASNFNIDSLQHCCCWYFHVPHLHRQQREQLLLQLVACKFLRQLSTGSWLNRSYSIGMWVRLYKPKFKAIAVSDERYRLQRQHEITITVESTKTKPKCGLWKVSKLEQEYLCYSQKNTHYSKNKFPNKSFNYHQCSENITHQILAILNSVKKKNKNKNISNRKCTSWIKYYKLQIS